MDFLDPKRKKAHRQRLVIGYILTAIAVAMGTLILLFMAYGFDIDRKTGSVIQNGTVYLDTQPSGAAITLNGQLLRTRTASRLVLPSGQFTVKLEADGYRPWQRNFTLESGQIEHLAYPLLLPKTLDSVDLQLYSTAPAISTTSPDRRWLLVLQPGQANMFDLYDLSVPTKAPVPVSIPRILLSEAEKPAGLTVVDWSNDNKHVLLDRSYGDKGAKHEYVVFNRETPEDSINLNMSLGIAPSSVRLRDKRSDQFYIYDAVGGIVRMADSKNKNISAPLLQNVIEFTTYNNDLILYVTADPGSSENVQFKIFQGDKNYVLRTSPVSKTYVAKISEYDGHWYYTVGSSSQNAIFIYKDPLPILQGHTVLPLRVAAILHLEDPRLAVVSASSQYIAVQGANSSVVVYDAGDDRQFRYAIKDGLPDGQKLTWMDESRLLFMRDGYANMLDFDGSNQQQLIPVVDGLAGPFFDRSYSNIFAIAPSIGVKNRYAFTQASLSPVKK